MTVEAADAPFRKALEKMPAALEASYRELVGRRRPVPTEGLEVTRAILLRMVAFYNAQYKIKEFLSKRYVGSASDFFVETIAFYVKALAETHKLGIEVASERQVRRARGAMRPDISLWKGESCVACIECKTQLGWNRQGWESQFVEREARLLQDHTGAASFLLVMTANNWPGFGDSPLLGRKYFVLSEGWPTYIDFNRLEEAVVTPIEGLFARIVTL